MLASSAVKTHNERTKKKRSRSNRSLYSSTRTQKKGTRMPIIKVWCLPEGQTEEGLKELHQAIVDAVISVKELCLEDETDMTVLFPPDLMKYGLGQVIAIEVSGLFKKPKRNEEVRQRLAERIGKAVHRLYPKADVECLVYSFNPKQGFWTSG